MVVMAAALASSIPCSLLVEKSETETRMVVAWELSVLVRSFGTFGTRNRRLTNLQRVGFACVGIQLEAPCTEMGD